MENSELNFKIYYYHHTVRIFTIMYLTPFNVYLNLTTLKVNKFIITILKFHEILLIVD